ncbi:MAG: hypothetical protein HQL56_08840 [Magnetococcales bacterium]|nr:hypothetical protein [Magnetococcales bacterium]
MFNRFDLEEDVRQALSQESEEERLRKAYEKQVDALVNQRAFVLDKKLRRPNDGKDPSLPSLVQESLTFHMGPEQGQLPEPEPESITTPVPASNNSRSNQTGFFPSHSYFPYPPGQDPGFDFPVTIPPVDNRPLCTPGKMNIVEDHSCRQPWEVSPDQRPGVYVPGPILDGGLDLEDIGISPANPHAKPPHKRPSIFDPTIDWGLPKSFEPALNATENDSSTPTPGIPNPDSTPTDNDTGEKSPPRSIFDISFDWPFIRNKPAEGVQVAALSPTNAVDFHTGNVPNTPVNDTSRQDSPTPVPDQTPNPQGDQPTVLAANRRSQPAATPSYQKDANATTEKPSASWQPTIPVVQGKEGEYNDANGNPTANLQKREAVYEALKRQGMPENLAKTFVQTLDWEGGFRWHGTKPGEVQDDSKYRGTDTAFGGLKEKSVREAIERKHITGVDLTRFGSQSTPDEIARMLIGTTHHSLANAGGINALKSIQDPAVQSAVLDSLFRHGMGDGAQVLQAGLEDINPAYVPEFQANILTTKAIREIGSLDNHQKQAFLTKLGERRYELLIEQHNKGLQNDQAKRRRLREKPWKSNEDTLGDHSRIQWHMRYPNK